MKLVIRIVTFYVMLKCIHSHYDYGDYYKRSPDEGYQNIPQPDYLNNPEMYPLANNYNYNEECVCSCDLCYTNPKECCMEYCTKCTEEERPDLLYYPYPYYIFNSPSPSMSPIKPTEQIIIETTTQVTTQATTIEVEEGLEQTPIARIDEPLSEDAIQDRYITELLENPKYNKNDDKVILTSLRRTKPRWMPKFGIVPIPDQLAENLMLKIRNMKVLHPEKDTVRRIESIHPRYEY